MVLNVHVVCFFRCLNTFFSLFALFALSLFLFYPSSSSSIVSCRSFFSIKEFLLHWLNSRDRARQFSCYFLRNFFFGCCCCCCSHSFCPDICANAFASGINNQKIPNFLKNALFAIEAQTKSERRESEKKSKRITNLIEFGCVEMDLSIKDDDDDDDDKSITAKIFSLRRDFWSFVRSFLRCFVSDFFCYLACWLKAHPCMFMIFNMHTKRYYIQDDKLTI